MILYANVTIIDYFNEFVVNVKHRMLLVLLLEKMGQREKAAKCLYFLKDLVEDTNNNQEAILVYEQIGKMNQDDKEYVDAIRAFKRMLQIAWSEHDQHYETKAYEYLALQYFYLQLLDKA